MATYWLRFEFGTKRGRYYTALRADTKTEAQALCAAGFERIKRGDINRVARGILLANPYHSLSTHLGYNLIATPDYEPDAYLHFAAGPWLEKHAEQRPAVASDDAA